MVWFRSRSVLALVSLGIGVGWGRATGPAHARQLGPTSFWAADRGRDRLLGLDRDLFPTELVTLRAPTRLAAAPRGGVYVVNASDGRPGGAHGLRYILPGAEVLWERALGPVLDLQSDGIQGALVEALPAGEGLARVLAVNPRGEMRPLVVGDVLSVARVGEQFLVGFESGLLQLWTSEGLAPVAEFDAGGAVADVAPAGGAGWWVLSHCAERGTRLSLHDRSLGMRWSRNTHSSALRLVPGPGPVVWCVADSDRPVVSRFGVSGAVELQVEPLVAVLDRGFALSDGGLLWVAPGVLLRLDSEGLVRPGQGGFGFLVDVIQAGAYQ